MWVPTSPMKTFTTRELPGETASSADPGAGEGKLKVPTLREVDTITASATIKGKATSCYSRMRASEFNEANLLSVVIGSVVC